MNNQYFNLDNTTGLTQEILDIMNAEYDEAISDMPDECHKSVADVIFNKYC